MLPKILSLRVYLVGDKPVAYGHFDEQEIYSIADKENIPKYSIFNSLQTRDIKSSDLTDLIIHDLIPDEDFEMLKACEMLSTQHCELFDKIRSLKPAPEPVVETTEPITDASEYPEMVNVVEPPESDIAEEVKSGGIGMSDFEKRVISIVEENFMVSKKAHWKLL